MGIGLAIAVLSYVVVSSAIGLTARAFDRDLRIEDTPVLEAAIDLARYSDERLQAAAEGTPLPDPPEFAADLVTVRIAYVLGGVNAVGLTLATYIGMLRWRKHAPDILGLRSYSFERLWKPAAATIAAYAGVVAYGVIVTAIDIDLLEPDQSIPMAILRDWWSIAIFGVLAIVFAPLSEEALFRGLIYGGLAKYGFWVAGPISGLLFAVSHIDPGTLIPFTFVGVLFAWLYRSSGSLWDSIAAHAMFNSVSFLLLLSTR